MRIIKIVLTLITVILPGLASTQTPVKYFTSTGDTLWNQTDKQGLKQGFWKVNYDNGRIRYRGFFVNDKPNGEMLRYDADGSLQAKLNFRSDGKTALATLYYNNGKPAASGKYIQQKKDSLWKYYSYYTEKLVAEEWYASGLKHGTTSRYYENGKPSETLDWKNGKKDGVWYQYFENGIVKLNGLYINDQRQGNFVLYYPTGKIEQKGKDKYNLMHGDWEYFTPEGEKEMDIAFENGVAKDEDKLLEKQREFLKLLEQNKGRIPEPEDDIYGRQR